MKTRTILLVAPLAFVLGASAKPGPRFERAYSLKPEEGVFAYSRISPDGRFLAYASETKAASGRGITQTVTVVDLKDGRILFTEPGIDAYWSNDGKRMIFLSFAGGSSAVSIRHHESGTVVREVAPVSLGDYFSWAVRDNKNLILTINSNFYYLDGDRASLPHGQVPACPGIGRGERPLSSHDGKRITTFVRGTLVVRSLTDCDYILDTGIQGAKADFSWDGRYIAFHAPKQNARGYDVLVVDLQEKTVRTVTSSMTGSSYFPNWTRDGRLSFRYDGEEYRGFMFASEALSAPARPLPATSNQVPARRTWSQIFPETPAPAHRLTLTLVWGTWSAHSPIALADLQRARDFFEHQSLDVGVMTATDPGSRPSDIKRILARHKIALPLIPLAPERLALTEMQNQSPATLLFRDGELVDRRLGAQTFEELKQWIVSSGVGVH